MKKIKNIFDGWFRYFFPDPHVEAIAKERLSKCNDCPLNSKNTTKRSFMATLFHSPTCTVCGCVLEAKTRALDEMCPKGLWRAEA